MPAIRFRLAVPALLRWLFFVLFVVAVALFLAESEVRHSSGVRRPRLPARTPLLHQRDFIIATSTCLERLSLIHASRAGRAGIRTFIAVGDDDLARDLSAREDSKAALEAYGFFPVRATEIMSNFWTACL